MTQPYDYLFLLFLRISFKMCSQQIEVQDNFPPKKWASRSYIILLLVLKHVSSSFFNKYSKNIIETLCHWLLYYYRFLTWTMQNYEWKSRTLLTEIEQKQVCLEKTLSPIRKYQGNKYQCLLFCKRKYIYLEFVSGTSKELHLLKTCLFWLMCEQLNATYLFLY